MNRVLSNEDQYQGIISLDVQTLYTGIFLLQFPDEYDGHHLDLGQRCSAFEINIQASCIDDR